MKIMPYIYGTQLAVILSLLLHDKLKISYWDMCHNSPESRETIEISIEQLSTFLGLFPKIFREYQGLEYIDNGDDTLEQSIKELVEIKHDKISCEFVLTVSRNNKTVLRDCLTKYIACLKQGDIIEETGFAIIENFEVLENNLKELIVADAIINPKYYKFNSLSIVPAIINHWIDGTLSIHSCKLQLNRSLNYISIFTEYMEGNEQNFNFNTSGQEDIYIYSAEWENTFKVEIIANIKELLDDIKNNKQQLELEQIDVQIEVQGEEQGEESLLKEERIPKHKQEKDIRCENNLKDVIDKENKKSKKRMHLSRKIEALYNKVKECCQRGQFMIYDESLVGEDKLYKDVPTLRTNVNRLNVLKLLTI